MINEFVKAAMADYEESAKALCHAVEQEYPVNSTLCIELGGHKIEVFVTGHASSWWDAPGTIYGYNFKSGKRRKFMPTDIRE